ncbi:hypothetical protein [Pseudomonas viridiflava]|uniref:hypothetical protein n=1 Tax=Pseudomonas viridiflava TaxID=33069 RepID=UPI0039C88DF2
MPSWHKRVITYQVGWSGTYINKAGLLVALSKRMVQITNRGAARAGHWFCVPRFNVAEAAPWDRGLQRRQTPGNSGGLRDLGCCC